MGYWQVCKGGNRRTPRTCHLPGLTTLFNIFSQGMVPYTSAGSKNRSSTLLWGSVYTRMMLPNTLSNPSFKGRQHPETYPCHTIRGEKKKRRTGKDWVLCSVSSHPPAFVCFQLLSWQSACVGVALVTTAVMAVFFISPASTPGTRFRPTLSWRHKRFPSLLFNEVSTDNWQETYKRL